MRVTDVSFVHGRDELGLLAVMPALKELGHLVRWIEARHGLRFRADHALIQTSLPHAEAAIRRWIRSL